MQSISNSFIGILSIHPAALISSRLEATLHVEGTFGVGITSALKELTKAINGLLEVNEHTLAAREDFGHEERLGKELFDLASTCDSQLVLFGKIVHTKNSNNILKGTVILEQLLYTTGNLVMNLTNNGRVKHT